MLKSWLNKFKTRYIFCCLPDEITRENVNTTLRYTDGYETTILELACRYDKYIEKCEEFLSTLLSLGAVITYNCFIDPPRYKFLLEAGADPNICDPAGSSLIRNCLKTSKYDLCRLFIDYGAKSPEKKGYFPTYASISNHRVFQCRKALLALIRTCKRSKFPALRGIMLCLAKQVWRLRGGDGCGARGHKWDIIA
jgi:hypothetical protein